MSMDSPSIVSVYCCQQSRRLSAAFAYVLENIKFCRDGQSGSVEESYDPEEKESDLKKGLIGHFKLRCGGDPSQVKKSKVKKPDGRHNKLCKCQRCKGRGKSNSRELLIPKLKGRCIAADDVSESQVRINSSFGHGYMEDESQARLEEDMNLLLERLQSQDVFQKKMAAIEIKKYAKHNAEARIMLAKMGAIPLLVTMLCIDESSCQGISLRALLTLTVGNNISKAAILTAGALPRLISLLHKSNIFIQSLAVSIFLSLSTLDVNKPAIGASGAVPALVILLEQGELHTKKNVLKVLCNLAAFPKNIDLIVESGVIDFLVKAMHDLELVEKSIELLGTLAATEKGRNALIDRREAMLILVNVLGWKDSKCQEKALLALMTMAAHSWSLRQAIIVTGAVPYLLELASLASAHVRSAASQVLDCLRENQEPEGTHMSISSLQHLEIKDMEGTLQEGSFVHQMTQKRVKKHVDEALKRHLLLQQSSCCSSGRVFNSNFSSSMSYSPLFTDSL